MMEKRKLKFDLALKYILLIKQKRDEHKKQIVTDFTLQTVKEFSSFQYEINVKDVFQDCKIKFEIHGLRTPRLTIPSSGPAIYKTVREMQNGLYEITISHSKNENRFLIEMHKNKVIIKESPKKKFIEVITDEKISNPKPTPDRRTSEI